MKTPGVVFCFNDTLHTPVPSMTPITGYKSSGIDLWIAKLSQTVKAASVKAPAQLACKVLTLYSTSTLVFIGMVLNVWDDLWSAACTNPFRDLFYSMFQFFNVLTFLFHLFFFSWFCFPWISFAEMRCHCAGIEAEQAWCAIVLHIKSW